MPRIVAIHSQEDDAELRASQSWDLAVPAQFPPAYHLVKAYGAGDASHGQLAASRATNALHDALVQPDVLLLTGVAHGSPFVFPGYRETLFNSEVPMPVEQIQEIVGKIIHFFACDNARTLPDPAQSIGQAFYREGGCRAFIGYTDGPDFSVNWLNDVIDCDSRIDVLLAQGKSVAEAINGAKARYEQKASAAPSEAAQGLRALSACLTCIAGAGADLTKMYLVP